MLGDLLGILLVALMVWCAIGGYLNDKHQANKTDSFVNGIGPDDKPDR